MSSTATVTLGKGPEQHNAEPSDSEDWRKLTDSRAQRRIQNRIAQRNRRKTLIKRKEQKAQQELSPHSSSENNPDGCFRNLIWVDSSFSAATNITGDSESELVSYKHTEKLLGQACLIPASQPAPVPGTHVFHTCSSGPDKPFGFDSLPPTPPNSQGFGSELDFFSQPGTSEYDRSASYCGSEEITQDQGVSTYHLSNSGDIPFQNSAMCLFADATSIGDYGSTALHLAVKQRRIPVIRLLLEAGMDLHAKNGAGQTALHLAIIQCDQSAKELLLEHGSNGDICTDNGETPLHLAVDTGDFNMVKFLCDHVSDFDSRNSQGRTAFHCTVIGGREDIVSLLLAKGIDAKVGLQSIIPLSSPTQERKDSSGGSR